MNLNTVTNLREEFLLNPDIIYFNHGSFGATPRLVFESYQRWQRELENQPTEFFGRRAPGLLDQSRAALAEFLGTASLNLAYVTNATTGLNVIARSLDLQPGDEILATNHEYGALDRTWRFNGQKRGYKYINHPLPLPVSTRAAFVDEFWKGVTESTRVIFISHITSPTGLIFPVEEVCQRARSEGILTIIDGAHAPGQIPLNLDKLGADFYIGNLHKWLCAPKGTGFLYARPEVHPMIEPLIISWGWGKEEPSQTPLVDYVEFQGTRDVSAFLAVPDAILFFQEHDWDRVRSDCHEILKETLAKIASFTGLPPISPITGEWYSQMACAPIPVDVECPEIHRRLYDDFGIEIPVLEWNGHKLVRISFQAYNTIEDAFALVNALQVLLDD
jgi:isopenicillin-N epimerase